MSKIEIRSAHIDFPIYNASTRSLKKQFIRLATGGTVVKDTNQHVVICALSDINLTLEHGDRVGLIGHNGAGKSTLLNLIAGIYEPTRGNIKVDGQISPMLSLMQGMEPELTGYENITLRGILLGLTRKEIRDNIKEISELTGLGDYIDMPVRTYSSGMKVRLAFAISTSIKPEILVIDEIFGAGDANFMQTARNRMVSLLEKSSIVVLASHSDGLIKQFCNKAILLDGGQIKYFGSVDTAFEMYKEKNKK